MDQKCSSLPYPNGTKNTRWDTEAVCMSVSEEEIRKATGRFNTPLEFWGCTKSPRYHADRFHTYRNCPNKRYLDVAERANQTIKYYSQCISMMGGSGGAWDIQGKWGHTSSMEVRSMFAEHMVQLT